jgi:hypothetical protein
MGVHLNFLCSHTKFPNEMTFLCVVQKRQFLLIQNSFLREMLLSFLRRSQKMSFFPQTFVSEHRMSKCTSGIFLHNF